MPWFARSLLSLALMSSLAVGCGSDASDASDAFATETIKEGSPEAMAILALVNDGAVSAKELDVDAALSAPAARNIVNHRDGADALPSTDDDDPFGTLAELDATPAVGPATLKQLLAYAKAKGYFGQNVQVIFSPQPLEASHNARVAELIGQAKDSLDIAMYSFSDAGIMTALEGAIARGV